MKTFEEYMLSEGLKLTKKDKDVITAFTDKEAADNNKFRTDGKVLDGLWMGGNKIAVWEKGKIVFNDLGSRSAQTVQNFIKKIVPKNDLNEKYTKFDDKTYNEVEFPRHIIDKVAALTDDNYHSEARIMVAKELKKAGNRAGAGFVKRYTTFQRMIDKSGGMTNSVSKSRYNMDQAMKQELQRTFSNWEQVWMAL